MASGITMGDAAKKTSSMDSSFPVSLPEDPRLRMSWEEFEKSIFGALPSLTGVESEMKNAAIKNDAADTATSTVDQPMSDAEGQPKSTGNAFVDALDQEATRSTEPSASDLAARNLTLTENQGVAFASTKEALTELFYQLKEPIDDDILGSLLDGAWKVDPLATLKIIWNVRSIHLGKGERETFYRALGWLKERHPKTLLVNLPWLFRGVIEKDAKSRPDDDKVLIEKGETEPDDHEVLHGVSHGYWKDLLNILVLSAENKLDVTDPKTTLKQENPQRKMKKTTKNSAWLRKGNKRAAFTDSSMRNFEVGDPKSAEQRRLEVAEACQRRKEDARAARHATEAQRFGQVLNRLEDPFHRALHLTVARLFADQLRKDMLLLQTGTKEQLRELSLCAKWAPTLEKFHDKHTNIATTIAEILFPQDRIGQEGDSRETYLKRAREHYRAYTLSPIRKALKIVERDITENNFANIKYNRVPSVAMKQYKGLFSKKDKEHFQKYLLDVALGKAKISGAILTPGSLVSEAKKHVRDDIVRLVVDGQWNTMVQRIKDSGTLTGSMAVCDVSGSMGTRCGDSGATCMDHAIGLSLLLSEVNSEPFGGRIITFSQRPEAVKIGGPDDTRPFTDKITALSRANWDMNTNFLAVFVDLILPLAVQNKVKQEDMVKRLFVFSDMQFDRAYVGKADQWATHHQIIEKKFAEAGYEVPELVYWNLAWNNRNPPVPATFDTPGTALVSGFSQAMLKVFLENGSLDDEEEEEEVEVVAEGGGDDGEMVVVKKEKKKTDPLALMQKVIGNKAFDMLKVVD